MVGRSRSNRRRLARVINDHFIARHLTRAFARWALVTFCAGPDPDAGGAFLHFENSHPVRLFAGDRRN